MNDRSLSVKIMEATYDHPNDRSEDIGRKYSPSKPILQHPQRLAKGFEDHAGMASVRSTQLERVQQGADKVPALMCRVSLRYALRNP